MVTKKLENDHGDTVMVNELGDLEFTPMGGKSMIVMLDDVAELVKFLQEATRDEPLAPIQILTA